MRKTVIAGLFALLPAVAFSAGTEVPLDEAPVDLDNRASLQRGARLFNNYCLSCHSAQYMRYSRMAQDLGLTDEQVEKNLMFAADKIGETMTIAMEPEAAADWFGTAPPDLTLSARARGADWLYTYLRSFYLDPDRPFGVNNVVFKDVAMPHVLWPLQGWLAPVYGVAKDSDHHGIEHLDFDPAYQTVVDEPEGPHEVITGLRVVEQGALSPEEYDQAVADLVNFMVYMAEPARMERFQIGFWVLLYLILFTGLAYYLKREYWKDVH